MDVNTSKLPSNVIELFIKGKDGITTVCGDSILAAESFIAVIDGATPKGTRLWDGKKGDVFVSSYIKNVLLSLNPSVSATEAITIINDNIKEEYIKNGTSYSELLPEERLQASMVIYSAHHREIWSFGDCQFKVNDKIYSEVRRADKLFADMRAMYIETARLDGVKHEGDIGREAIMPLLKECIKLANAGGEFGYDAINGGPINPENIKTVSVNEGDFIVLASDGYPKLFDTLKETESYLFSALEKDPDCIGILRSTKGLKKGNESFDDRSYISFKVE